MRIAVFSDVQGNLPAFEAAIDHMLSWAPDLVIMAGDLINRGPSSRPCLERFDDLRRNRGWIPIRGNHEDWVLRCDREAPADSLDAEIRRFADWTRRQLANMEGALVGWADHLCLHEDAPGSWVHVTHGSLAGNRDGISMSTPDEELIGKVPEDVALFVTAHTHKPLKRRFRGTDILNVGSVGSPFDGDTRSSYAQLELRGGCWCTRILRVAYDRGRTERDFEDSGFIDDGGPLARIIFEEWRRARLLMPTWHHRYMTAVRNGDLTLTQAVDDFLASVA
jgi:predicted phosphodiesterase